VDSTPRAYRLKAGNAGLPISTSYGTFPGQVSAPLSYAAPYVYGPNSSQGFDDVVFDGRKVFLSETNPANPGDPVVVRLDNGQVPFGKLMTSGVLRFGDTGTNPETGQHNQTLPMNDPDSLKLLSNGELILTSGNDGALTLIKDPGTANQSESFIKLQGLPAGTAPGLDDAIMPMSSSGTFYVSDTNDDLVEKVTVSGLNTNDIYASVGSLGAIAEIDPHTGKVTPFITGLDSPHGLVFVPSTSSAPTPNANVRSLLKEASGSADLIPGFSTSQDTGKLTAHGTSEPGAMPQQPDTWGGTILSVADNTPTPFSLAPGVHHA
jgi:hypothetical protein